MRNLSIAACVVSVILFQRSKETESQAISPTCGSPVLYAQSEEDNLGMLLTVLLLAGRNRNQNGCGRSCCCNCCENCVSQNVPIPFPIPIPTNTAIITRPYSNEEYDDEESDDDCKAKNHHHKGGKDHSKTSNDEEEEDGQVVIEEEDEIRPPSVQILNT